jgi:hypothetical protein
MIKQTNTTTNTTTNTNNTNNTVTPVTTSAETPAETSADKFIRLGNMRVNNALNKIRLIGNLANYQHTQEQTEAIIGALLASIETVQNQLENKKQESSEFKL